MSQNATKKTPLRRDDLKARYERARSLLGQAYALLVLDDRPIPKHTWENVTRAIGEYLDATEVMR